MIPRGPSLLLSFPPRIAPSFPTEESRTRASTCIFRCMDILSQEGQTAEAPPNPPPNPTHTPTPPIENSQLQETRSYAKEPITHGERHYVFFFLLLPLLRGRNSSSRKSNSRG